VSPRKIVVGPTAAELRMRTQLDLSRREVARLKKLVEGAALQAGVVAAAAEAADVAEAAEAADAAEATAAMEAAADAEAAAAAALEGGADAETAEAEAASAASAVSSSGHELESLRRQVAELSRTKTRLSRLYFSQVEENRKRALKLHEILENISRINSELDLDILLGRLAETMRSSLGFRIVLLRIREPGTNRLRARAFAGLDEAARGTLSAEDVLVEDFLSWLRDEFKVSRSYLISHRHEFNRELVGYTPDLGEREEWEWHKDDMLLVPIWNRTGELVAYFSVDDPEDRLVPSRESIELLEIFGNHAGVAIENARLYQQLEQHGRDLEAAGQRMQEMHALKSNFISTVSHELRTPLTAIRAYVDTLLSARDGEVPFGQTQRFLGIINEESQRLARLIESMLDLNRFDSGTMRLARQPIELAEVIEDAARLLQPVAEAGQVDLKVQNDAADTRMDADRDQMKQLALHLGSNAVKFTPPGGSVTLRLSGDARDVTLQVEDTGIGIPEPLLEKIFERFYQVDSSLIRRFGGTGLGLAICKSIVEWHGGRVFAESTPGVGSRFTVVLPRRTGPRVTVRPNPQLQPATEDVLKLAIEMVAEVMNARVVSLLTPGQDGDLVVQAALGLDEQVVREASIKPGRGVAGWVAQHRRPVCVSGGDERREVAGSGREGYRTGTFLSVPLEGESGLLGVLSVTDPVSEKPFDAEDCHLLLHLAERVGAAWEQAQAMEHSRSHVEGTARALRGVLEHLDRSRRSAPDRVRLARATARELGLPEAEVGVISFAASIHDVGMASLGEKITENPSTLSPDEQEALERHPERGAELLRPLETMGVVRDVVLSHHEWWDGSGYPRGIAGEAIPIGGRILAVVDAFESMIIGRAHREMLSPEDALAELRLRQGTQFDPAVVEVFGRAWIEVEKQRTPSAPDSWEHATTIEGGE
jgi:signal transduction histidine kinase/HD-GYP domain-containing protein (c-di-GMP phosphodiesterase class II)